MDTRLASKAKNEEWEVWMAGVPVGALKNNWDYKIIKAG